MDIPVITISVHKVISDAKLFHKPIEHALYIAALYLRFRMPDFLARLRSLAVIALHMVKMSKASSR